MTQELSQLPGEVLQRLDALAAKVGTSIELLWPALVRYEYARSGVSIASAASLVLISAAIVWVACSKETWVDDCAGGLPTKRGIVMIVFFVIGTISLLSLVTNSPEWVAAVFSPEAAALRSILGK